MSFGNKREFIDHLQSKEGKEQAVKCPMKFKIEDMWGEKQRIYSGDCLKEECACWDSLFERCDPTGLAHTLERLTDILAEIERKMPHAGQFTK